MRLKIRNARRLHRFLAPFVCLPLLITTLSGSLFQIIALQGQGDRFLWLLEIHRGKFGQINLEWVYPFLNAFGLLMLVISGTVMWLSLPRQNFVKTRQ